MQEDHTIEQDITNVGEVHLTIKDEELPTEATENRQDETVLNLAGTSMNMAPKNHSNLFLESLAEKRKIIEEDSPPRKSRQPSRSFNRSIRQLDKQNLAQKPSMIDYIEKSVKLNQKDPQPLPPLPKKELFLSLVLMAVGVVCLLIATVSALDKNNKRSGIALWTIGTICALPGVFYAVKFCRAYYAKTTEERRQALEEVPFD